MIFKLTGRTGASPMRHRQTGHPVETWFVVYSDIGRRETKSVASERLETTLGEIRRGLEARKRSIAAEMRDYPQPIAGCDAQYQHLSDQRAAIARDLSGLDRACAGGSHAGGAFIESSTVLDDESRRRLRAALAQGPA